MDPGKPGMVISKIGFLIKTMILNPVQPQCKSTVVLERTWLLSSQHLSQMIDVGLDCLIHPWGLRLG